MQQLSPTQLADGIKQVFIDSDRYMFDKYVPVFKKDDAYFADAFSVVIVEPIDGRPPIVYHTFSPYDIVSKKAPDQALVFQDGELILNTTFTPYIKQRTGTMAPLVMQELNFGDMADKRLLFVGTGMVAQQALEALVALFPSVRTVDYINTRGDAPEFTECAAKYGLTAKIGSLEQIGSYDVIVCHTSSKQPMLTKEHLTKLKPGAFVASFASEDSAELTSDYYATSEATVIVDWEQTIAEAPELQAAVTDGTADKTAIIMLKDLFSGAVPLPVGRKRTVYRSHGTPMQNLAVLKLLVQPK